MDQNKYGTLIQGLSSQFSLGQDQYPKTIVDANSILSTNHQLNAAYATQLKKQKEKEKASKDKDKDEQEAPKLSFAQMERQMLLLWQARPQVTKVSLQEQAKSKWAINKMPEIIQAQSMVTASSTISQNDTASITMQPVQTSTDTNVIQATSPFQWMAV